MLASQIDTRFPTDDQSKPTEPKRTERKRLLSRCCLAEAAVQGVEVTGDAIEVVAEPACCLMEAASSGDGCCLAEAASVVPDVGTYFVATAALKTDQHPDLVALRRFRDQILAPHLLGRLFIRFYYRWGRYPARAISGRSFPCWIVRILLVQPAARVARWFD